MKEKQNKEIERKKISSPEQNKQDYSNGNDGLPII